MGEWIRFFTEAAVELLTTALSSWPVVLVVALILFRGQLAQKIGDLEEFSGGIFAGKFPKKMSEAGEEADDLISLVAKQGPETDNETPLIPTAVRTRLEYQEDNAASRPGASIASAWNQLEEEALKAAETRGLEDLSYSAPTDRVLERLSESTSLPAEAAGLARKLRRLRDLAVNSRRPKIHPDDAREYVAATRQLIESIERSTSDDLAAERTAV